MNILKKIKLIRTYKIRKYIKNLWHDLRKNGIDIISVIEEKFVAGNILYIPASENIKAIRKKTDATVYKLPKDISSALNIKNHGLLYLPKPYIVPGGRFNEMYGWDTYFINIGLIYDNLPQYALDNIENFIYQIKHYKKILNGNRTYYLDRSHPPLFSQMCLEYYEKVCKDDTWLAKTLPYIEKYFNYWRTGDKFVKDFGLSKYCSEADTPPYEVVHSEEEAEYLYYDKAKDYFKSINDNRFYNPEDDSLTKEFYKADRSIRESGFDLSYQFGQFSSEINDTLPVCLNSLLYVMADDIAKIAKILGKKNKEIKYNKIAQNIKININKYLLDNDQKCYFNYNFNTNKNTDYLFCTCFYPMWAGVASKVQAEQLVKEILPRLEGKWGLFCSEKITNMQWDSPFCWAPLMLFAVKGLMKYGYKKDAKRLAKKWMKNVEIVFRKRHVIKEKYYTSNAYIKKVKIKFGYSSNEVGFGWTNAVYLYFLNEII